MVGLARREREDVIAALTDAVTPRWCGGLAVLTSLARLGRIAPPYFFNISDGPTFAIGAPEENIETVPANDAGVVQILYGT